MNFNANGFDTIRIIFAITVSGRYKAGQKLHHSMTRHESKRQLIQLTDSARCGQPLFARSMITPLGRHLKKRDYFRGQEERSGRFATGSRFYY